MNCSEKLDAILAQYETYVAHEAQILSIMDDLSQQVKAIQDSVEPMVKHFDDNFSVARVNFDENEVASTSLVNTNRFYDAFSTYAQEVADALVHINNNSNSTEMARISAFLGLDVGGEN